MQCKKQERICSFPGKQFILHLHMAKQLNSEQRYVIYLDLQSKLTKKVSHKKLAFIPRPLVFFFNNYPSIEAVFLMTQTIYKWAKVGVFCYFSPIYQYLYSANKSSMVTTACTMLLYSPARSPYVVMSVGKMLSFAPVSATKSPIRVRIFRLSAARISGRNLHFFCIFRPLMSAFFCFVSFLIRVYRTILPPSFVG